MLRVSELFLEAFYFHNFNLKNRMVQHNDPSLFQLIFPCICFQSITKNVLNEHVLKPNAQKKVMQQVSNENINSFCILERFGSGVDSLDV